MLRIKRANYVSDYKLRILFSNGKTKIVDFEDWIFEGGAYLEPLKDIEFFKKFKLDESHYTICWPNGADFCPDVLYEVGREIRKSTKVRTLRRRKKTTSSRR